MPAARSSHTADSSIFAKGNNVKSTPFGARFFRLCLGLALVATSAMAQSSTSDSPAARVAAPQDRVRGLVTDEQRTVLKGQSRRMEPAAVDQGELPPSLATGRMVLWLRRSAEQQERQGLVQLRADPRCRAGRTSSMGGLAGPRTRV